MTATQSGPPIPARGRVLVVDDDAALSEMLGIVLRGEGFDPVFCADGAQALNAFRDSKPDLVLLDLMLPGRDGIDVCRAIRAESGTPIVMLTAKSDTVDVVVGLESGADDYIVKPFSVPELIARVRALLRRASPERVADVLNHGDIELDREKKRVSRSGREIELGPTEYRLLEFLMERPGRVFSREQLLDGVWGSEVYIDERTVDVHVGRLRKALNRGREADPIRTVRGAGYALDDRFGRSAA